METVESVEVIRSEIAPVVAQAQIVIVRDQSTYDGAIGFCRTIKEAQKKVIDFYEPMKKAAHEAHKRITESEKDMLDPLKLAESTIKSKILSFDREQERIRMEQQRKLQAEADEAARRERERLEKEAAKLKTPELKAARLEQAAAVVAPVVEVMAPVSRSEGVATVKTWKARILDPMAVPRDWLIVNEDGLDKFAKATKGAMKVAGVEFYQDSVLSVKTTRR